VHAYISKRGCTGRGNQPTMASDTPLLVPLLGALTSANLSPFAQHNRERICIWRLCRPGESPPNDGYGQGGLPGWEMVGREKKGRRRVWGRRDIEKRRRGHARTHARRYTFSVGRVPALGCPAPSAAIIEEKWVACLRH
jgi:hypothetical protein